MNLFVILSSVLFVTTFGLERQQCKDCAKFCQEVERIAQKYDLDAIKQYDTTYVECEKEGYPDAPELAEYTDYLKCGTANCSACQSLVDDITGIQQITRRKRSQREKRYTAEEKKVGLCQLKKLGWSLGKLIRIANKSWYIWEDTMKPYKSECGYTEAEVDAQDKACQTQSGIDPEWFEYYD